MEQLLNIAQAAEYLNVSRSLLYRYVTEKGIACVRLGSRILFRAAQLEAFIDSCSKAAQK